MALFRHGRRNRPVPYRLRSNMPLPQAVVFDPSLRRARDLVPDAATRPG